MAAFNTAMRELNRVGRNVTQSSRERELRDHERWIVDEMAIRTIEHDGEVVPLI